MGEIPLQSPDYEGNSSYPHAARFALDMPATGKANKLWPFYRGTSLIRNRAPLGPYSRTMPRALWKT